MRPNPVVRHGLVLLLAPLGLLAGCAGSGGSSSRAATAAGSTAAPSTALTGLAVEVDAPADATHHPPGPIEVRGRVGAGAVEVRVAGRPAALQDGAFRANFDLQPGLNPIEVEALDASGGRSVRLLTLLAGDLRAEGDRLDGAGEVRLTGGATGRASAIGAPPPPAPGGFPPMRWIAADPSNYTRHSGARQIRWIVVHTIEGSEAGCISWMRNPVSNVSSHYVLSRTGRVTQMVQDDDVAWHVRAQNPYAIGIENEGYAGQNLWTDVQYETLARLVRALADKHGVPRDRQHIVGHGELPGQTHWDPGPHFDWGRFMRLVNAPRTSAPARRTRTLVSPEGAQVELQLELAPAADDASGRSVVLGARTRAPAPVRPDFPGTPAATDPRAGLGGRSGPDWDAAVAVHQDALAGTLLAAWRAGALELKLDETRLGALAPASTGALEASALIAREPALAGLLEAGEQVEVRLTAELPPLLAVTPGEPSPLLFSLGAARLDVGVFHPLRQERRRLGRLDLALRAPADLTLAGDDAALRPGAPAELHVGLASAEPGSDAELLRRLGELLAPTILEASAGALRGVTVPLPERLGLQLVRAEAEGRTLVLLGR